MITAPEVYRAKKYAIAAHGSQKYGDEFPYAIHLQAVESVLIRFGVTDSNLLCAAWLHDTLEDTDSTYESLVTFFGTDVANIVTALTEPKEGNRASRHAQTYPRIAQTVDAIVVKLADRIANVEAGGKQIGMYVKEHVEFKRVIGYTHPAREILIAKMWNHLDDLIIEAGGRYWNVK